MANGVNYLVRGQSGFELDCGHQPKTRVVFAVYDRDHKSLAWYLFSSTVDPKSQKECENTDAWVTDDPFGIDAGLGSPVPLRKSIGVHQLVSDAKSPIVTVELAPNRAVIEISLDNLNTKSNGMIHLGFPLRKIDNPPTANVPIRGRLWFLEHVPHPEAKFSLGPQGKGALEMISRPPF
jgi:hypothetical protein